MLSDVAGLLIVNESQVRRVGVRPPNPALDAEFVVKYAHVDEVEAIEEAITGRPPPLLAWRGSSELPASVDGTAA